MPLNEFTAKEIFVPMGMPNALFLPPANWIPRIAPTEEIDLPAGAKAGSGAGKILRGTVHDPRARQMGGVAGHAGLFSTADDLALFCKMMLAAGVAPNGKRIFAAATVRLMTRRNKRRGFRLCAALAGILIRHIPRRAAIFFRLVRMG